MYLIVVNEALPTKTWKESEKSNTEVNVQNHIDVSKIRELYTLYASQNVIWAIKSKMGGYAGRMGERRKLQNFGWKKKMKGKRPVGRPRRR